MGKHIVKVLSLLKDAFHRLSTALFLPSITFRSHHLNAGIRLYGIHKSALALFGWRRAFKSAYLHDASIAIELLCNILSHRLSYQIIVTSDESRVFVRVCLSVIQNDWNAFIISTSHCLRDGTQLVWRHDKQIYPFIDKLVYLLVLQRIIIRRRSNPDHNRVIDILTYPQFVVQLLTPNIFRALRHTNHKLLAIAATTHHHAGKHHHCQHNYQMGTSLQAKWETGVSHI